MKSVSGHLNLILSDMNSGPTGLHRNSLFTHRAIFDYWNRTSVHIRTIFDDWNRTSVHMQNIFDDWNRTSVHIPCKVFLESYKAAQRKITRLEVNGWPIVSFKGAVSDQTDRRGNKPFQLWHTTCMQEWQLWLTHYVFNARANTDRPLRKEGDGQLW